MIKYINELLYHSRKLQLANLDAQPEGCGCKKLKIWYCFKYFRFIAFVLFISSYSFSQGADEFQLQEGTVVKLADVTRAKELLMIPDEYTGVMSKFDLQSKTLRTDNPTLEDYLKFSSEQALEWNDTDKVNMKSIVESVSRKISSLGLKIKMPDKIEIIKSTMKNEGGANGYTRSNYIVLKDKNVTEGKFEDLLIHELFHVFSRYDAEMRERVYNTLGFKKTSEVAYPSEIANLRISNPDAPFNDYYLTVNSDGKSVDVMLILFAGKPYEGGSFFSYLQIGLLAVEGEAMNKKPVYKDGKPVILKVKEVKNFYEQIGKNTAYILHAEEVSADQLVMLLNGEKDLPNPELIDAMKNSMK